MDPPELKPACYCFELKLTIFYTATFNHRCRKTASSSFQQWSNKQKPLLFLLPPALLNSTVLQVAAFHVPQCVYIDQKKRKKYFTPLLAYGCLNTFVNMTVVQCCKSVKSACRQCTHSVKPYLKHTTAPQTSFPRKSAERVLQPF